MYPAARGLIGLMGALPGETPSLRAPAVLMDDGHELPIGGAHGALRGWLDEPAFVAAYQAAARLQQASSAAVDRLKE